MIRRIPILVLILAAALGAQEFLPGRYIIEFEEPGKLAARTAAAQKQAARSAIEEKAGGVVRDSLDVVINALVVDVPPGGEAALAQLPGVRKVHPVRLGRVEMNRAPAVTRATEAWRLVNGGQDQAGAGIRIGIIDGGIDKDHPAFQDASLRMPDGFPRGNREADLEGTNSKIIVFRNYDSSFLRVPRDRSGHGTAVASAAAGVRHLSPAGEFSGIAPKAYLGAYKVYGDDGRFGSDVLLRALEDAVNDGMDVINLSLGFVPQGRSDDEFTQAVDRVVTRGVVVTKSAGNYGPDPGMGSSPNSVRAISVGAQFNDRTLGPTLVLNGRTYGGSAPDGDLPESGLTGEFADVATVDSTALACGSSLPAGSFAGKIVLIARGVCTFEEKLNNAIRAGARGAVIYTDDRPVAVLWIRGSALLPALMVSAEDGLLLKNAIAQQGVEPLQALLDFRYGSVPQDAKRVTSFSSRGPSAEGAIQPEIVSVGEDLFLAAQRENPSGDVHSRTGYAISGGTSFSAPMVAGAAAVLRAQRPGLTPAQYKSLLVNSASAFETASGAVAPVMSAGAGKLDVERALRATTVAEPAVISFGAFGLTVDTGRNVSIRNLGPGQDTYSVTVSPLGGTNVVPLVTPNTFTLSPGEARTLAVRFSVASAVPGAYHGFLLVKGANSEIETRIPYWYGANDGVPVSVAAIPRSQTPQAGGTFEIYLRIADSSGAPVMFPEPAVEAVEGGGEFTSIQSLDDFFPGIWFVRVRLGLIPGQLNTFRIKVGDTVLRTIGIRP